MTVSFSPNFTIRFLCTIVFTATGVCAGPAWADEKTPRGDVVEKTQEKPLQPKDLLAMLPPCPEEWVLKRSQARTVFRETLGAFAMREYEEVITELEAARSSEPLKPETVIIAIRDTCGCGPHLAPFRKETAPPRGGDFKLGAWNRYPAMMVEMGKERKSLRILVKRRFVVEVVFSGDNLGALDKWLAHCDLRALTAPRKKSAVTIKDRVWIKFVDELRPERSRAYFDPVDFSRPKELPPAADASAGEPKAAAAE